MNLVETILARGEASSPAVLYQATVLSYGELRQNVARLTARLLECGCVKGDRIGLFSENNPFFVTAYLGIIRAGLVVVPLQTELLEETFARIILDAGIKQVLVSKRFAGRLRPWTEKLKVALLSEPDIESRSSLQSGVAQVTPTVQSGVGDPLPLMPEIDPARDLAALMFTSGSTGEPKGVMVSHRNIECNTQGIISYLGLGPDDRAMVVLPFYYCFGISLLHTHLMAGGSVVLNNDFKLYPETVLQEMQQKECTGLAGVPSTYQILLRKSRFPKMSFPKLRWFQQAGGKLPNACIQEIVTLFPNIRYFLMYGQTEATARLSYLPPERLADKLGSIGKGLPSTKLEVTKPDGTPVLPGSEETGEIVAGGDNITLGYWNDPAETAKFFQGGQLRTGDIARVDTDGFIFIVEREREMIKSGGNRVSAKEVEDVIAEIPTIVEVAVMGGPHELLGEAVKAFVVLSPMATTTARDVEAHCRKRLTSFKIPQEVIILNSMPHNGSGKVLKAKLKEILGGRGRNESLHEPCPS